jgi:hypothetical protein
MLSTAEAQRDRRVRDAWQELQWNNTGRVSRDEFNARFKP